VAVWEWTIDYANRNPLGGGFDSYRANSFTYVMPVKEETDNTVTIQYQEVTDEARAFHSSVFEVLGEQGYPGLIIWLSIHLLGVWQMEKIYRRWRGVTEETESWIAPMASALQMASLIYFVGALFQGIAYQPAFLMIVGLQIGLDTYVRRLDSAKAALDEEKRLSPSEKRRRERARAEAGEAPGRGAVTA
jgi:O-antigen ligase